jgi:hypothetical protein
MPPTTTATLTLTLPASYDAGWLRALPTPQAVVDVLELARMLHGVRASDDRRALEAQFRQSQAALEAELEGARADAQRLRSERALVETTVRQALQAEFDERQRLLGAQHAGEVARLAGLLEEERQSATTMVAKVDELCAALCGTSNARGQLGEHFVEGVHAELALGVLKNNSNQRRAGVADATWSFTPPGADAPLAVLVEIKNVARGATADDLDKFERDVRAAAQCGRVHGALYLSLVGRVPGKRSLELELLHGVPVLWASRAASDDLSARSLVQLAFASLATALPLLTAAGGGDGDATAPLLAELALHFRSTLAQCHEMEPRITWLERTAETMRREAVLLRKSRDKLVQQVAAFETRHQLAVGEAATTDEAELRAAVVAAIAAFHAAHHGRYPKAATDLPLADPAHRERLAARPELFHACDREVRDRNQASKRRREAGGAGEGE